MYSLLARQVGEILDEAAPVRALGCERSLRVAATTVANAQTYAISATRVVGVLGRDDQSAFEIVVARLAEEFELVASLRFHAGSFAVRFCRPTC